MVSKTVSIEVESLALKTDFDCNAHVPFIS